MRSNNRRAIQERKEKKSSRGRVVTQRSQEESRAVRPVSPIGQFQRELLYALNEKDTILVDAPAGAGKTFVVMSTVSDWLKSGKIKKIVLSRPSVGMGNTLGLLPGDIKEKFEPFLASLVDVLVKRHGQGYYETQMANKNIEFVPLEYIRGRSFDNAIVIVDEFQNTSEDEAYTILTRLGQGSKMVLMGDRTQNDMRGHQTGLEWAIDFIIRHQLFEFADVIEGNSDDIVRSKFCKAVVKAREKDLRG